MRIATIAFAVLALMACGNGGQDAKDGSSGAGGGGGTGGTGNADAGPGGNGGAGGNDGPAGGSGGNDVDAGIETPPNLAPEVDPQCIDGKYTEILADYRPDISAEIASYTRTRYLDFTYATLDKRYPNGRFLVEGGVKQNCIDRFSSGIAQFSASAKMMMEIGIAFLVHECGHVFDSSESRTMSTFIINKNLRFACPYLSAGATPTRSAIKKDQFASQRPPCTSGQMADCDGYASIYLDGQGFEMLLEELVQYINSLAVSLAYQDAIKVRISDRDGALTFLWYLERYLYLARTKYPSGYNAIVKDDCYRRAILTSWGRAWLYLVATEQFNNLGIEDEKIIALVRNADLLNEIELLRQAAGCM